MNLPAAAYRANYTMPLIGGPSAGSRGIAITEEIWKTGQEITMGFIGGTTSQIGEWIEATEEIRKYANLTFKIIPDWQNAMIRIKHIANQSWSYIGQSVLNVPRNSPTTSAGWDGVPVRLHELMHAVAFAHEHSHPLAGIQWNMDVLIEVFTSPFHGWTIPMIEANFIERLAIDSTTSNFYDPESIMHYEIHPTWTTNGFQVPKNTQLSAGDKQILGQLYPFPEGITVNPTKTVEADGSVLIGNVSTDPEQPLITNPSIQVTANLGGAGLIIGGITVAAIAARAIQNRNKN